MRLEESPDLGYHVTETVQGEGEGEGAFGGVEWPGWVDRGGAVTGLAQDGADPGVGVLKVDTGVAGERHHALDVEAVVLGARGRQVGVFHCSDADVLGDLIQLGLAELVGLLGYGRASLRYRGIEQVGELDGAAGAGLERPPVGAQDRAERDVDGLDLIGVSQPARRATSKMSRKCSAWRASTT